MCQKFKIGDFVVCEYACGKVIDITNDAYLLDTNQGIPFSNEHNAHIWTVEDDAKDGDILAHEEENGVPTFAIFEKYCDFSPIFGNRFLSYCDAVSGEFSPHPMHFSIDDEWRLATRNECLMFFTKMLECGYFWDTMEKKVVKKP